APGRRRPRRRPAAARARRSRWRCGPRGACGWCRCGRAGGTKGSSPFPRGSESPRASSREGAPPRRAGTATRPGERAGSTGQLISEHLLKGAGEDCSDLDYDSQFRPTTKRFTRATSPVPVHVRSRRCIRDILCGSDAFFSLFGWRFLRRSLMGIWRPMLAYTLFAALFVGSVQAVPLEHRTKVEHSLKSFAVLFDFTRVFLVFTLTAVVGTMYGRWWEMRRLIGVVMGKTQDTTIMITSYIQGDDSEELMCELVRYLNLAHVLVHMQARSKHGKEVLLTFQDLQRAELVTQSERQIIESLDGVSLHQVAYMWFLQLWLEVVQQGLVPKLLVDSMHAKMQENISMMRGAASDIFMYQNTPPPIGYFRVLYLLLNVSLLISPLGVYASLLSDSSVLMDRWMVVPVVFMIAFFMLSFVHMCHEMFDPFSEGLSHFPLRFYLGSTLRSSYSLLGTPREGRLCFYAQKQVEGSPSHDAGDETAEAAAGRGRSPCTRRRAETEPDSPAKQAVFEYERLRHANLQRTSGRARAKSISMGLDQLAEDSSEREALRDMHEGNLFLGRSHWSSAQHQRAALPTWASSPALAYASRGGGDPEAGVPAQRGLQRSSSLQVVERLGSDARPRANTAPSDADAASSRTGDPRYPHFRRSVVRSMA
ncbi:unnamed protein product, partial [Prorocentrum cordatum]